jgi:hypothetical protein
VRPRSLLIAATAVAGLALVSVHSRAAGPAPGAAAEAGLRDYAEVYRVLLSPRCRNCHPAGQSPLQGDAGRPHAQNISRTSFTSGLKCTACHRQGNSPQPGAPPGAPSWHMPPANLPMVFEGRSPAQLCAQLKDRAQTGGRRPADLIKHVEHDPFVLWAWQPGPGRQPPPLTHAEFVARVKGWVAAGAPCPTP